MYSDQATNYEIQPIVIAVHTKENTPASKLQISLRKRCMRCPCTMIIRLLYSNEAAFQRLQNSNKIRNRWEKIEMQWHEKYFKGPLVSSATPFRRPEAKEKSENQTCVSENTKI
jgi:hypothetical protein